MSLCAIIYVAPIFSVMGVISAALGGWWGQIYLRAQLPVKREMSNTRAPIIGHLSATLAGLGQSCHRPPWHSLDAHLSTYSYDPGVWRARALH